MAIYHIKVKKGRTDKPYPADKFTVTTLPKEGYYAEHPEVIGMPPGQKVRFETEYNKDGQIIRETILLPRDGQIAFVLDSQGNTIDSYPKKRDRVLRNVEESKGSAENKVESKIGG